MNSRDPWQDMQSAPPVIGRHHGGHGGGRRRFGGWGGGWGWGGYDPYWDYPPYDIVIEDVWDAPPTRVSGRGVYRDNGIYRAPGLLTAIAPIVAAGSGGMSVALDLDKEHRLHASICVDGKCYRGSIDVAPLIAVAMTKIADLHHDLHARDQRTAQTAVGCAEDAIDDAGTILLGAMLDHHQCVMCAGFFDDIGNAVTGVVNTIGNALKPLEPIVAGAATIGATAVGGPAAGAIAGKLVTASLANAGPKKQEAQKVVATVKQQAKTNPQIAAAVDTAHKTAAQTMVAYHVLDQTKKAAAGDSRAQAQIAAVDSAAQKGDPAGQWALGVVEKLLAGGVAPTASRTSTAAQDRAAIGDIGAPVPLGVGVPPEQFAGGPGALSEDEMRAMAAGDPTELVVSGALPVILFVATALGGYAWWKHWKARDAAHEAIIKAAEADKAKDASTKLALTKEAIDKAEAAKAASPPAAPGEKPPAGEHWYLPSGMHPPTAPTVGVGADWQKIARKMASDHYAGRKDPYVGFRVSFGEATIVPFASRSHAAAWFSQQSAVPGVSYAAYFDATDGLWPEPVDESVPASATVGAPWSLLRGGPDDALAGIRRRAHELAESKGEPVVAVMLDPHGNWYAQGFGSSDSADDWFGGETRDPHGFVYAAYYDKHDATWPGPLNEAIGKAKAA